jgi:hypothetical protein
MDGLSCLSSDLEHLLMQPGGGVMLMIEPGLILVLEARQPEVDGVERRHLPENDLPFGVLFLASPARVLPTSPRSCPAWGRLVCHGCNNMRLGNCLGCHGTH